MSGNQNSARIPNIREASRLLGRATRVLNHKQLPRACAGGPGHERACVCACISGSSDSEFSSFPISSKPLKQMQMLLCHESEFTVVRFLGQYLFSSGSTTRLSVDQRLIIGHNLGTGNGQRAWVLGHTGPWGASPLHCPLRGEHLCVGTVTGSPGPRRGAAPIIRAPVPCEVLSRSDCPPGHPAFSRARSPGDAPEDTRCGEEAADTSFEGRGVQVPVVGPSAPCGFAQGPLPVCKMETLLPACRLVVNMNLANVHRASVVDAP